MNDNSLSAYSNSSVSSESFNEDEEKSSSGYPTINVIFFYNCNIDSSNSSWLD